MQKNLDFNNEYSSLNDFPPDLEGKDLLNEAEKVTYGFGLAIKGDLQVGTSGPCATFRNPCLSSHSGKSEVFQIFNLEVWAFTPCINVEEAEKMENARTFCEFNRNV